MMGVPWPNQVIIHAICVAGLFIGCSPIAELSREVPKENIDRVDYSIIYYIHADDDYLYHDSDGQPIEDNLHVLEAARKIAEEARSGEVFIFYQRPEKKILGIFPRRSSQFYYYTNGRKTTEVKYRHSDKDEDFLATEGQLYNQYRLQSNNEDKQRYFLYFGHEIPNEGGAGYHRTLSKIRVDVASLATGLRSFLPADDQQFSLVALSTCNNGTPAVASHFMPLTDYLLASPQNLHLSHINSEPLYLLEQNPDISPRRLALALGNDTFQRLSDDIHTTITLALYDFDSVQGYISELLKLTSDYKEEKSPDYFGENIDCKQLSFFDDAVYTKGVETWYNPARFGKRSTANNHSGWGCKPVQTD